MKSPNRSIYLLLLGAFIFVFIGCGNNDNKEELEKLKRENEALKTEMLAKEREKQEEENKKLREEKEELKQQMQTRRVSVSIQVDNYKPDGRKWDGTGAPDVSGKITFPDGSVISIPKHQNSYTASGSTSGVKLKIGDQIDIFLEDRDLSSHDLIASGSITYEGGNSFTKRLDSAQLTFTIQ